MKEQTDKYSYAMEPFRPEDQPLGRSDLGGLSATAPLIDIGALAGLILRKWWIVLGGALVLGVLAAVYMMGKPDIFGSSAVVYVGQETERVLQIQAVTPDDFREMEELMTVEHSLASASVLLRVIEKNGLRDDPTFMGLDDDGKAYSDNMLVNFLGSRVQATLRRGTRLIDVHVEDTDAERARRIARSVVDEFMNMNYEQRLQATRRATESLVEESERLKERLEDSERDLQVYRQKHPDLPLENDDGIVVAKLRKLNDDLSVAKAERLRLATDVEQLEDIDRTNPEAILSLGTVAQKEEIVELQKAIDQKEAEFAKVQKRYGYKHPTYISLESELIELQLALHDNALAAGENMRKRHEAAIENEEKLAAAVESQNELLLGLNDSLMAMRALEREVESDRELYDAVQRRLKETHVTEGIQESHLRLVEEPMVADFPFKPRKKVIVALAFVFGGIMGVGLIFVLNLLDGSLRTVGQVERALGIPGLTTIPDGDFDDLSDAIAIRRDPNSRIAEAFRMLRTSLSFTGLQGPSRSVLFTSAGPDEGKSFSAMNYAVALASQGYRTLLIDADLRRPSLCKALLKEVESVGLSDHLSGTIEPGDACYSTDFENLYFLPSGTATANPAELLGDERFPRLLAEAYRWFDRIIIDSSPVGVVSDPVSIANCVQSVCLVVRAGKTQRKAAVKSCRFLQRAGAPLAGFVLNGSKDEQIQSYHAYQTQTQTQTVPRVVQPEPALAIYGNS
ncbi:MAG: polysaccharide biosynthesis tyrosine autokinase [Verrucomicrobiota bacterium]